MLLASLFLVVGSRSTGLAVGSDKKVPPRFSHSLPVLVFSLVISSCAVQTPPPTHIQYPVVAAFANREDVYQGSIDNNLMNGTAYVDVAGESSGMHCRGEGHLTDIANTQSCQGGQGKCSLTCDDGTSLTCTYTLSSCVSGQGVGEDQKGNWFAFRFGSDIQGARTALLALRLQEAATKVAAPPQTEAEKPPTIAFGTGFFVSSEGDVVTAYHVVDQATRIAVVTRSGQKLKAEIVDFDKANDVALLKVDATSATPLFITTSSEIAVGEEVLTIGYPLVQFEGVAQKATFGHVNALSGTDDDVRYLQIDAPVQPGNSGGPVLDPQGRVVGVVEFVLDSEKVTKEEGTAPQNVNYAVKSDYLLPLLVRHEIKPRTIHAKPAVQQVKLVRKVQDSIVLVVAK